MTEELLIEKLLKYNWDTTNIKLALRAKFKCEYCDKNMFESIDNYKLWQVDHIIPKCSGYLDCEDFDNKALSCTQCNKDFLAISKSVVAIKAQSVLTGCALSVITSVNLPSFDCLANSIGNIGPS